MKVMNYYILSSKDQSQSFWINWENPITTTRITGLLDSSRFTLESFHYRTAWLGHSFTLQCFQCQTGLLVYGVLIYNVFIIIDSYLHGSYQMNFLWTFQPGVN